MVGPPEEAPAASPPGIPPPGIPPGIPSGIPPPAPEMNRYYFLKLNLGLWGESGQSEFLDNFK